MKTIDFKTSNYFSETIFIIGVIFSLTGIFVLFANIIIGLGLLFSSVVIFTTHYRLSIDYEKKVFHDYLWILGMKSGEKGNFEEVEYLFIKKNRVSQTMSVKVASATVRKEVYDGYLRFSETEKIHLLTKDNKKNVVKKLREISSMLKVRIIDYSEGEPKEI
ncbi:MAG TPA: hypothetical protein PLJ60_00685 [Chryseolinea sp.]|nr:hypothetical protein [Chryseolinea sp.]HPM28823.1 hypothetical protein [Chryseolinea sp.]